MTAWSERYRRVLRRFLFFIEGKQSLPRAGRELPAYASATVDWIRRAQLSQNNGGVSERYEVLSRQWTPSYPETTGYIICTLLRAANAGIGNPVALRSACLNMGNWLTRVQMADGAFSGGHIDWPVKAPAVFNTGQIVKGLTDLTVHGLDTEGIFKVAADKAVEWLIQVQDADGCWRRHLSALVTGPIQAYNIRTAWAMARHGRAMGDDRVIQSSVRNADWLMKVRRLDDDWFPYMNFDQGQSPILHTVAYTINGLLEIGCIVNREDMIEVATRVSRRVMALQSEATGAIPGQIEEGYHSKVAWTSTTANAQMAIIWARLYELTGQVEWRQAAERAVRFNCSVQELDWNHTDDGRRGGLRGSWPCSIGYGRYLYMNWTQKFHLDSLLALQGVSIV